MPLSDQLPATLQGLPLLSEMCLAVIGSAWICEGLLFLLQLVLQIILLQEHFADKLLWVVDGLSSQSLWHRPRHILHQDVRRRLPGSALYLLLMWVAASACSGGHSH